MEERSLGGQVNLARSPAQTPGAAQGSSYFNRQEAILAIRHVSFLAHSLLKHMEGRTKAVHWALVSFGLGTECAAGRIARSSMKQLSSRVTAP